MNNYMRSRLGGCAVLIVILAVVGLGAAIYWGVVAFKHSQYAGPFQAQMAAYLAPPQDPETSKPKDPKPSGSEESEPAGQEESKPAGVVKGKMIVLDAKTKDFDWEVTDALPAELKAVKPEEVGTVVLTEWHKNKIDEYNNGAAAYQYSVDVTVVDHARRTVIAKTTKTGSEPPYETSNSSEDSGSKPTNDVVEYLKGLPRQ